MDSCTYRQSKNPEGLKSYKRRDRFYLELIHTRKPPDLSLRFCSNNSPDRSRYTRHFPPFSHCENIHQNRPICTKKRKQPLSINTSEIRLGLVGRIKINSVVSFQRRQNIHNRSKASGFKGPLLTPRHDGTSSTVVLTPTPISPGGSTSISVELTGNPSERVPSTPVDFPWLLK